VRQRRARPSSEAPKEPKAGDLQDVTRLRYRADVAVGDVDQCGRDHRGGEGGGHGEKAVRAYWSPRHVREPDSHGDRERSDVARHVSSRAGVVAEEKRGNREHEFDERDREQGPPHPFTSPELRGVSLGDDPGAEVRHRIGDAYAEAAMQDVERVRMVAAVGARGEVRLERYRLESRDFAIEAGRESFTERLAVHALTVACRSGPVPIGRLSRCRWGSWRAGPEPDTHCPVEELTRLALRARDGDREALERFIQMSQGDVWRLCAHLGGRHEADDLTQDTFLRAIGALGSFRGDSSARTWLLVIARRTCVDEVRRSIRRRRLVERTGPQDVESPDLTPGSDLDALVGNLEVDRRLAFVLTQVLGVPYAEAAEICGCPIGTIRSRVARARSDLIAWLGGQEAATG
jgi:RNA polymerase sigma-70 factor, ECF subfamily